MVLSIAILFLCGVNHFADAHGGLMIPPTWTNTGSKFPLQGLQQCKAGCAGIAEPGGPTGRKFREFDAQYGGTLRCNCYWYTNWTRCPVGVKQDIVGHWSEYKTYHGNWTWKQRMPWSCPGKAQVNSPCGSDGGNPLGCWTGSGFPSSGNTEVQCASGGYSQGEDARNFNFAQVPVTTWAAGSVQEVAWGLIANHGGGYAYRLCKLGPGGRAALTEECFQNGHLHFAEEKSYFQKWSTTLGSSKSKTFQGETGPWRRNPIPACTTYPGGEGCDTQFEKPSVAGAPDELYGFVASGFWKARRYLIKDKVLIPTKITAGDYVLSWRYDAEQTPQVWFGCSSIKITSSYIGPQTFALQPGTPSPAPAPAITGNFFTAKVTKTQTDGKYFFIHWNTGLDKGQVDGGEVHKMVLTTCRNDQIFWRGPMIIWKRAEVLGRRDVGRGKRQFEVGDVLTDAEDCAFVVAPEAEPETEQEAEPETEAKPETEAEPEEEVSAKCWMVLPTGCKQACPAWDIAELKSQASSASIPWFEDTHGGASAKACTDRQAVWKSHCGRVDVQSHWGSKPSPSDVQQQQQCWAVLPSGCSRHLEYAAPDPRQWFVDPYGCCSATTCSNRRPVFNAHCSVHDTVTQFGLRPGGSLVEMKRATTKLSGHVSEEFPKHRQRRSVMISDDGQVDPLE